MVTYSLTLQSTAALLLVSTPHLTRAFADCNNNNIDDLIDIQNGTSTDCNNNSIPDECEGFIAPVAVPDSGYAVAFGDKAYFNILSNDVAGTGNLPPTAPDVVEEVSQPPQGVPLWDDPFGQVGKLSFTHSENENDCSEYGIGTYRLHDSLCQVSNEATYTFFIPPSVPDCNCNCIQDFDSNENSDPFTLCPIASGSEWDSNENGQPDSFETNYLYYNDCNQNGINDIEDILLFGIADQNGNLIPDTCEDALFTARTEILSASTFGSLASLGAAESAVSADGHFTAFVTRSSLGPPANGLLQVVLRDRSDGTLDLISKNGLGAIADADSDGASISTDGRYVTFCTRATNIVAGNGAGFRQVYRLDRAKGKVELVSISTTGQPANGDSSQPDISADGSIVAFTSLATNLVSGDTNGSPDVFSWTLNSSQPSVTRVSLGTNGVQLNAGGSSPSLSADGKKIAFQSDSTNVIAGDVNLTTDVFLYDQLSPLNIRLLSTSSTGGFPNGPSSQPSLDYSGRTVAYQSAATNIVAGDTNGKIDVFVRDWTQGVTSVMASVTPNNQPGNGNSFEPSLSEDGKRVAFTSVATNLVTTGTAFQSIFLRDLPLGATVHVNRNSASIPSDGPSGSARISGDGSTVTFTDLGLVMHGEAPQSNPPLPSQVYARDFLDRNRDVEFDGNVSLSIGRRPCQQPLGPFTIEAWVLTSNSSIPQTIVAKWRDKGFTLATEREFAVELAVGGGVRFLMARTDNQEDSAFHEFTAGLVETGKWHHVACTYDGNARRIYIDGVLAGQKATTGVPHPARADIDVGARVIGATIQQRFVGWMDEVRLWTEARSAVEIQQFMNSRLRTAALSTYPKLVFCHSFESNLEDTRFFNPATWNGTPKFAWMNESPSIEIDCDSDGVLDWEEMLSNPGLDANGDGLLDACQCAASTYCVGAPNSAGPGATLTPSGSGSISLNDFAVTAGGCPTNNVGLFFFGTQAAQVPFGDGFLCIGGTVTRFGGQSTGPTGSAFQSVDWGALPGPIPALAGQDFYFQFWYRDPTGGPAGFNLSNAAALTLCP